MENPALATGGLKAVDANNQRILAFIREDENQTYLIIANLSNQEVLNVSLSVDASRLSGAINPTMILGEGSPASLTVGENGAFEGYVPLTNIPAKTAVILKLR